MIESQTSLALDTHITTILLFSVLGIMIYTVPRLLKDRVLTSPIFFVLLGVAAFLLPFDLPLISPDTDRFDRKILEYFTEFIVIVSLASIGLKIDRKPTFSNYKIAIYMLGLVMPLSILGTYLVGSYFLGLGLASSILLGAVIAPTDPVLANNVQVGPPNAGKSHPVRFGLTVEAGLNDGLAFPFVFLALVILQDGTSSEALLQWFSHHLLLKILLGTVCGYVFGRIVSKGFFYFFKKVGESENVEVNEGLFLISAAFLCYALTEWFGGYGFLAVFISSVVARQEERAHSIHEKKHNAVDQIEQTALYLFLFIFGGLLATVDFHGYGWIHIIVSLIIIFIVRPVAGYLGLFPYDSEHKNKLFIAFFGIRGIGSIYYLAFAHNESSDFYKLDDVWYVVVTTIVISIVVHGLSSRKLRDHGVK